VHARAVRWIAAVRGAVIAIITADRLGDTRAGQRVAGVLRTELTVITLFWSVQAKTRLQIAQINGAQEEVCAFEVRCTALTAARRDRGVHTRARGWLTKISGAFVAIVTALLLA